MPEAVLATPSRPEPFPVRTESDLVISVRRQLLDLLSGAGVPDLDRAVPPPRAGRGPTAIGAQGHVVGAPVGQQQRLVRSVAAPQERPAVGAVGDQNHLPFPAPA